MLIPRRQSTEWPRSSRRRSRRPGCPRPLNRPQAPASSRAIGPSIGHGGTSWRVAARRYSAVRREKGPFTGGSTMARPGLEPGTPRFSVVGHDLSNRRRIPANRADLRGIPGRAEKDKRPQFAVLCTRLRDRSRREYLNPSVVRGVTCREMPDPICRGTGPRMSHDVQVHRALRRRGRCE
jgi:hypothetical protein